MEPHSKYKNYFILGGIVLVGIYLALNSFSYFDPLSLCRIKIHGNLAGNRDTIKEAIKEVKRTDRSAYGVLCRDVDAIYEMYCIDKDWNMHPKDYVRTDVEGCYITGSHFVYLTPSRDTTKAKIAARAAALKKFSALSRDFWLNKKY
jgi:hypothetical protein